MVTSSTLKSPVLIAFVVMGGVCVATCIVGLFALAIVRDGAVADQVITTFTGLLAVAFGAAGPVITHLIYSLSGVSQPGAAANDSDTATVITTKGV